MSNEKLRIVHSSMFLAFVMAILAIFLGVNIYSNDSSDKQSQSTPSNIEVLKSDIEVLASE